MFRTSNFDKYLEKATSHLLLDPDWPSILALCDSIRQNDTQPKYAINAVKKKLFAPNPHSAYYSLLVLESIVKNCGTIVHEELTSKAFCDTLHELAKTTTHDNVRQKLLELLQTWSTAFRKNPKHTAMKDLVATMKAEGFKFPTVRESEAMFTADTAPKWADGEVCHRCRVSFSLIQRKHHCRACGQVFCGQCTPKTVTLPKFGIEKEVRVCDGCFDQANKPVKATDKEETELPLDYLNSSLAQQNQAPPPRKTEDELREEEEFQLALALSQSEAEAKEQSKSKSLSSSPRQSSLKNTRPTDFKTPSPVTVSTKDEEPDNPELARYLNRTYWESITSTTDPGTNSVRPTSPSAPSPSSTVSSITEPLKSKLLKNDNTGEDLELEEFIRTLKSQVEIFINRMKSNSSRGRSITNDTSVQTLFMNITAMHSKLLNYIQKHDDSRLYYERLQDTLTQVKDARAALDALRDEHREKLKHEAEEAERLRQMQMAHKLDIMRKKKQEYLQYQRQLALQRIQEQEREMQMRQEQQKQQYLMGPQMMGYHGNMGAMYGAPPNSAPPQQGMYQYQPQGMMPPQSAPAQMGHPGMGQQGMHPQTSMGPQHQQQPQKLSHPPGFPPHMLPQQGIPNHGQNGQPQHMGGPPQNMGGPQSQQMGVQSQQMGGSQQAMGPQQTMGPQSQHMGQQMGPQMGGQHVMGQQMGGHPQGHVMGHPGMQSGYPPHSMGPPGTPMMMAPPGMQQHGHPMSNHAMMGNMPPQTQMGPHPGAPPASPQIQHNGETQTAELISFD